MGDNEKFSPGAELPSRWNGYHVRRYGGEKAAHDGQKCEVLIVANLWGDVTRSAHRWLLDSSRGFLPVESQFIVANEMSNRTVAMDVRRLRNGGFFPFRSLSVTRPDGPSPHLAIVVEVLDLVLGAEKVSGTKYRFGFVTPFLLHLFCFDTFSASIVSAPVLRSATVD